MDFYFNINKDSTYVRKYSTLVCFHPGFIFHINFIIKTILNVIL
jgi:hypothetical protein